MVPHELQTALDGALRAMRDHPLHRLTVDHRLRLYAYLGPADMPPGRQRRGHLAIATAMKVLPVWQRARPHDDRARHVLTLATQALWSSRYTDAATWVGERVWYWILNDYGDRQDEVEDRVLWALGTAVKALFTALGDDPISGVDYDAPKTEDALGATPYSIEDKLDPYNADAAEWASFAVAGVHAESREHHHTDLLAFWTWWLTEAVPQAWDLQPLPPRSGPQEDQ